MTTTAKRPEKKEEPQSKVLDLMSLAPTRQLVRLPTVKDPVEGETFELRQIDDFGIEDQHQLLAWSRRYQNLMSIDEDLSDDQKTNLRFLLNSMFELVLDAPKSTKEKMTDGMRTRVVNAFSMGPLLSRQEAQMEVLNRLKARGYVKEEQVDEILREIRMEVAAQDLITGN